MFKYILCVLIVVLVFIVVHMSINKFSSKTENFKDVSSKFDAEVNLRPHDVLTGWLANTDTLGPDGGSADPSSGSDDSKTKSTDGVKGTSLKESLSHFKDFNIKKIIVLVDREEGGKESIEKLGYKVESVFTVHDFKNVIKSK